MPECYREKQSARVGCARGPGRTRLERLWQVAR